MTTRTYYLPKNRLSLHILNDVINKISCSIGDIKTMEAGYLKVPITCNDRDIKRVENALARYDLMSDKI